MGSFEAPVMGLLQSESSLSAGAADPQLQTTAPTWAYVALKLVACLLIFDFFLSLLLHEGLMCFHSTHTHVLDYGKPQIFALPVISVFEVVATCHPTEVIKRENSALCAKINIQAALSSTRAYVAL